MLREYIALVHEDAGWRQHLVARIECATELRVVFSNRTIDVLTRQHGETIALGDRGVLIGRAFHRYGPSCPIEAFRPDEVQAITKSRGAYLIERCWGGYVSILEAGAGVLVLRDPSGAMACYQLRSDGVSVFASDAGVLRRSGLLLPEIDWEGLGRHLYTDGLPSHRTGIVGVDEVLPGTAVFVEGDLREIRTLWSPWHYVSPEARDFESSAEQLRSAVRQSVRSWASCHRRVLVGISGGLDSSIVASCLAEKGEGVITMTMATADADGDERAFADLLCREIGTELVEEFYSLSDVTLDQSAAPHLPLPVSRSQAHAYNATVARLASTRSIDAFYTGNGGDNVFAFSQSAAAIYDRFLHEGLGLGTIRTLIETCRLTGCSPWQALKATIELSRATTHGYRWRAEPLFLRPDLIEREACTPMVHPWLEAPNDALPGKAAHIAGLLRVQRNLFTSEKAMGIPVVNPLMAQPVIEVCLGIPSWRWRDRGLNRAVARAAFSTSLPSAIAYRTTKGRPDSFCNEIIEAHRSRIGERLVDGHMARHALLDREAVTRALSDQSPNMGVEQVRLLAFVETEAWLDHWIAT
ncbi:MAG TPA: asparagine synthase-related protein [Sphingobium sp.]|uniref:asparagine synthase-related protein n=1 Tax=Sphingobium sp. TaxID=1912891 RepID=UPI002ED4A860